MLGVGTRFCDELLLDFSKLRHNAGKVKITGTKLDGETHYYHTGYSGGIKGRTLRQRAKGDQNQKGSPSTGYTTPNASQHRNSSPHLRLKKMYADTER